ncbi:MAG: long-chain fatty acid--CoA ligase [Deltaproteobacteria bacterium]|nr:long-chain fatty acid--CoA ligase [Deltaproteobacteria bacterium]MBW2650176.1 long-chain fatty acid--CoA ligase [Deltaproteobacteria bacterium]
MSQSNEPDNLVTFLEGSVAKYPDRPLFGTKNSQGEYEWINYAEVGKRADNLRAGLAGLGVGKDDAVGIIANNRTEWAIGAFATYGLGARWVPMYESELLHVWKYIITDSCVKILFVSKPEIYEQLKNFVDEIPTLEKIFLIEGEGENSMAGLEKEGEKKPVPSIKPGADDIAALIYTSGTTGDPKGVLLSHGNFTSNSHAGRKMYPELMANTGISLSILPWAHSYGQTAELYTMIYLGGAVGFMENVKTLAADLAKVKPTWLIAVPRVFNKIYDGLWSKMNEAGGLPKKLFVMGVESAKKRRELAEKGKSDLITNLKFKIADKIVFQKIRNGLGGRLMGSMTGSAMMNPEIALFFFDIGIPLYDCYGMSETSPAITMNSSVDYKLGTVGKPIEKVRVVIDKSLGDEKLDDGEIVVYGPNVMKGYHNKPEQTREVITVDGGMRTGDRGRLDEDGFLHITGRIKEQFKLENGKFVFPSSLEEDICLVPYVENAMIYGEGRAYNVCLVIPDFLALEKYARKNNLPSDPEKLVEMEEIKDLISGEIVKALQGKYGGYEIPKKFVYLTEGFSLENGTLTQTMKLKRRVVLERYQEAIDEQYKK